MYLNSKRTEQKYSQIMKYSNTVPFWANTNKCECVWAAGCKQGKQLQSAELSVEQALCLTLFGPHIPYFRFPSLPFPFLVCKRKRKLHLCLWWCVCGTTRWMHFASACLLISSCLVTHLTRTCATAKQYSFPFSIFNSIFPSFLWMHAHSADIFPSHICSMKWEVNSHEVQMPSQGNWILRSTFGLY